MEEFFAKYGVADERHFFGKVADDPVFARRVASDFFYEKFPPVEKEQTIIWHPDHPNAAPPRVGASSVPLDAPADVVDTPQTEENHE